MKQKCQISGEEFEISDLELQLRKKFDLETLPTVAPQYRLRHLGAFWHHWNLYRRKCEKTGNTIISVFSEKCPYPVWHKDEWLNHADPPGADFDPKRNVFDQMWDFFQKSPLPHKIGAGNENCEYTDDWWYGKNCYLCHSGVGNEDLRYCYRPVNTKDSHFCVFTFDTELCVDAVNCRNCFEVIYALYCRNCQDSAFLYDCRNCSNCLFCFNLRNKQYCIGNKQLTKEQFEAEKKKWNFSSRKTYEKAKKHFAQMMRSLAHHRAQFIDKCESSTGNFLENNKNCENCFFIADFEDCANCIRGALGVKDSLEGLGNFEAELIYASPLAQDNVYFIKNCFWISQSKYMEYCGHCTQCEHCFGCCGLVGKKYYIFNKPYSEQEYKTLREKIIDHMRQTGEHEQFFPGYFAVTPYEESISSVYFPLSQEEQKKFGFRQQENTRREKAEYLSPSDIPDSSFDAREDLPTKIFWDENSGHPFQIQKEDIAFCQKLKVPLPNTYYIPRMQENFRWMHFDGALRKTNCSKCERKIETTWNKEFDPRILCESCYLDIVK